MKQFIAYLLLGVLLGMIPLPVSAQQNQSSKNTAQEIQALKNRISELEKQLQTVENVEKLELQAKLSDANTKLAKVRFDKFKQDLRVDNDDRMRAWSYWFFSILGIFVVISGAAIGFLLKTLIANSVEKNLKGFKDGLEEQNKIKNELGELAKAHAANVLWGIDYSSANDDFYSGEIKVLSDETLLELFQDEKFHHDIRCKAAKVLATRKYPKLVTPASKFLNSILDSNSEMDYFPMELYVRDHVKYLGEMNAHRALMELLNRLLSENPRHKGLLLPPVIQSLAQIGVKLNMGDWGEILRRSIDHLEVLQRDFEVITVLATYFDRFNEPEGIKEILDHHGASLPSEVIDKCLELLQGHDPQFVNNWRARETADPSEV